MFITSATIALILSANPGFSEADRYIVYTDIIGQKSGTMSGANPETGEVRSFDYTQNCFAASNPNLIICENDFGPVITHDVHQIDLENGDFIISYNGLPNPQTHRFEIKEFSGSAGDWTLIVESEDQFGSNELNRQMIYVKNGNSLELTISNRPIGSEEPFEWSRTHTLIAD